MTAPTYSITVFGPDVAPEEGARIVTIFLNALKLAEAMLVASAEAMREMADAE